MRLATWNVNSIRARIDRVIAFLERSDTDVLAMQEIKCRPDQFPTEAFTQAGYEVVAHSLKPVEWGGYRPRASDCLMSYINSLINPPGPLKLARTRRRS